VTAHHHDNNQGTDDHDDKAHITSPPPRYKMAILMTGVIFVLINTLLPQIRQLTMGLPVLLSTLVGVAIMVVLMNYVIMPSLTKLLRPWLAKNHQKRKRFG
jgi:antibiotic biosynthesis monooxygenase (ABM) superfamily enzyme